MKNVSFLRIRPCNSDNDLHLNSRGKEHTSSLLFKDKNLDIDKIHGYGFQTISKMPEINSYAWIFKHDTLQKYKNAPYRAPMVIVLITNIKEHPKVPDIEQMLSTAAAAQNMNRDQLFYSLLKYCYFVIPNLAKYTPEEKAKGKSHLEKDLKNVIMCMIDEERKCGKVKEWGHKWPLSHGPYVGKGCQDCANAIINQHIKWGTYMYGKKNQNALVGHLGDWCAKC